MKMLPEIQEEFTGCEWAPEKPDRTLHIPVCRKKKIYMFTYREREIDDTDVFPTADGF